MFLTKRVFQDEQLLKSLSTKHELEVKNDEQKPKDDGTAVDTQENKQNYLAEPYMVIRV
jgi:hypothetical protein